MVGPRDCYLPKNFIKIEYVQYFNLFFFDDLYRKKVDCTKFYSFDKNKNLLQGVSLKYNKILSKKQRLVNMKGLRDIYKNNVEIFKTLKIVEENFLLDKKSIIKNLNLSNIGNCFSFRYVDSYFKLFK